MFTVLQIPQVDYPINKITLASSNYKAPKPLSNKFNKNKIIIFAFNILRWGKTENIQNETER